MSLRKSAIAAITAFTVTDEDRTMCLNCHISAKPGERIVHARDCCFGPMQAALDILSGALDAPDLAHCEACGSGCQWDQSHSSEGCSFCPKCWAEMIAEIAACPHNLKPYSSEAYDDGLGCEICGGIFPKDYVKGAVKAPETVQ